LPKRLSNIETITSMLKSLCSLRCVRLYLRNVANVANVANPGEGEEVTKGLDAIEVEELVDTDELGRDRSTPKGKVRIRACDPFWSNLVIYGGVRPCGRSSTTGTGVVNYAAAIPYASLPIIRLVGPTGTTKAGCKVYAGSARLTFHQERSQRRGIERRSKAA
jgi:hypothetical protein